jgi:hypothetical protein
MCFLSLAHAALLLRGSASAAARWAIFMLDSFPSRKRQRRGKILNEIFTQPTNRDHLHESENKLIFP